MATAQPSVSVTSRTARNNYRASPNDGGAPTAAITASRSLPPSTEERLASLRAAREKRKESGVGATGNTAATSGLESGSSAAARLAARRLAAAQAVEGPGAPSSSPTPIPDTSAVAARPAATTATATATATAARTQGVTGTAGARTPVTPSGRTNSTTPVPASPAPTTPVNPAASTSSPASSAASGRTLPSRRGTDGISPLTTASRRPSQLVIDKEKKTDYWKDVERTAAEQGSNVSGDDLNSVISRAMSLGIVGDRKQRESLTAPQSHELLEQLKSSMEKRLVELNGGKQINFDSLLAASNTTTMDKVIGLERALTALESRKTKEEEEEKKRVQNKIGELERSLRALEAQKLQQREQNRRTMKLEIANLKEMMAKVQKEKDSETQAATEAKALSAKMNRLEAALRLMNQDRKKGSVEDKDTLLLRRKLALFEQKLQEMEVEKKIREEQDQGGALRDKLLEMEDKLAKMERRKSTSLTLQMQQKMEAVEKQLAMLRNERSGGHSDSTNTKIAQKMAMLEKQLQTMTQQKITPSMIQDEETLTLRDHISKLEEAIGTQEKRMEEQRLKLEEERKRNYEKRLAEEEAFRQQAKKNEEQLMKRIMEMESKLKSGGGGGGGPVDPALIARLKKLEEGGGGPISPDFSNKFTDLEKKLDETQKQLAEERKVTADFFATAPKEGPELEAWQKNAQIAWLLKANDDLMQKLSQTSNLIDEKMKAFSSMKFVGGGAAPANKSGLTYAEINAKLAEIQAKLFDSNTDEREGETLNIEYEKLITELEQTPEYQKEQEETKLKWKKENEAPNKEAFEKVYANLKAMPDQKLTAVFKRKPELKFIMRTPEQILRAHANDFTQVSTQNLLLIEARALYHNMPNFRRDQEQQGQFVHQLQAKIEAEASKPQKPAPPPIAPKKTVVIKTKKSGGGGGGGSGGDFLAELLQKRKKADG